MISKEQTLFKRKKVAQISSFEAWQRLTTYRDDFLNNNKFFTCIPVEDYFYQNKKHRNYLSTLLEKIIKHYLINNGGDCKKVENQAKRVDNRKSYTNVIGQRITIGSVNYIKNTNIRVGEPDLDCFLKGKSFYIEVKVGKDYLQNSQKEFIEQMKIKGKDTYIIKTLDEFWTLFDQLNEK